MPKTKKEFISMLKRMNTILRKLQPTKAVEPAALIRYFGIRRIGSGRALNNSTLKDTKQNH
jgi:hypothetical protein